MLCHSCFILLCVYNVGIPSEFSEVIISESMVGDKEAYFILTIVSSVFPTIELVLSDGDGSGPCVHTVDDSSTPSINLTCPNLNAGASYSLSVNLSVGNNCLIILINFNTTMTSSTPSSPSGMLPVRVNVL